MGAGASGTAHEAFEGSLRRQAQTETCRASGGTQLGAIKQAGVDPLCR